METTAATRPDLLATWFHEELALARAAQARGDIDAAWSALERAHVLSQSRVWLHVVSHWRMLLLAVRTRDLREVLGQVPRLLVAGPGSAVGRAPLGNTGRARVGILTPMPIPPELAAKLRQAGVRTE